MVGPSQKLPCAADFDALQARIAVLLAQRENHLRSMTATAVSGRASLVRDSEEEKATRMAKALQGIAEATMANAAKGVLAHNRRQDMGDNTKLRGIITGRSGLHASKPRDNAAKRARRDSSSADDDGGRSSLGKGKKARVNNGESKAATVHPAAQHLDSQLQQLASRSGHVAASDALKDGALTTSNIDHGASEAVLSTMISGSGQSSDGRPLGCHRSFKDGSSEVEKLDCPRAQAKLALKRPTMNRPKASQSVSAALGFDIPDDPLPKTTLPSRPINAPKTKQHFTSDSSHGNTAAGDEDSELDLVQPNGLPEASLNQPAFSSSSNLTMKLVNSEQSSPSPLDAKAIKRREAKRRQKHARRERDRAAKAAAGKQT